jgi:hypothetical protein
MSVVEDVKMLILEVERRPPFYKKFKKNTAIKI